MIEIVAAIIDRLKAGVPPVWGIYDLDATGASRYPYVLLLPPAGGMSADEALSGHRGRIDDELMVRAVGTSGDQVRGVLGRTRGVLSDGGQPLRFDAGSWRVSLRREPGRVPVMVDRDITITAGAHPMLATDFYTLTAAPHPSR